MLEMSSVSSNPVGSIVRYSSGLKPGPWLGPTSMGEFPSAMFGRPLPCGSPTTLYRSMPGHLEFRLGDYVRSEENQPGGVCQTERTLPGRDSEQRWLDQIVTVYKSCSNILNGRVNFYGAQRLVGVWNADCRRPLCAPRRSFTLVRSAQSE